MNGLSARTLNKTPDRGDKWKPGLSKLQVSTRFTPAVAKTNARDSVVHTGMIFPRFTNRVNTYVCMTDLLVQQTLQLYYQSKLTGEVRHLP